MAKATGVMKTNLRDGSRYFDSTTAFFDKATGEKHVVNQIFPKEADVAVPPIPASAESLSKLLGKFSK